MNRETRQNRTYCRWRPPDMDAFLRDYFALETDETLSRKHGGTNDNVKKLLIFLRETEGLPSRDDIKAGGGAEWEYRGAADRKRFHEMLSRSRTRREIEEIFGDQTDELLRTKFEGYNLFEQINDFGENCYCLLPEIVLDLAIQPKIWSWYRPAGENGYGYQPYLMIQMPETTFASLGDDPEIRLVPLFDVHLGHHAHKEEKFRKYLRYIAETPNVFTWLGGDLVENALDDGRGMTYEQELPPMRQQDLAVHLLAPIAHKILWAQPGNHEWRTYNKTGVDPTAYIASRLQVPYSDGPLIVDLLAGGKRWRIHSDHGHGYSQTKGGKMNAAGRPRKFTDGVQFFVSGHVHDPVANSETVIVVDPVEKRLIYPQQWTIIAPSFLRWEGTYAYRAGFAPPGAGGVSLHLYKNGEYEGRLYTRS
jgi:hypothetical protein